ncbi:hypothetical protein Tco_1075186 [Tanacetum coccineum]
MCMEVLLGIHGVWDVVDPGLADAKKNNIVKGLLFQSIPEDLVFQIGNLKTGKEMWEAIKTRNLGADRVKEARLQTLITEFENLKMSDNDTIDAYAAKLSDIDSKSATLGEVMSEHKLVKKFLTSLPRRFVHIVAALEQVLDLKTTGFEDVNNITGMSQQREEDVAHIHEVVTRSRSKDNAKYTPPKSESNTDEDDVWYYDNNASNHVTGIEVSQGKYCVDIKQERYAMKILKEADLTYSVGVVSRSMQSPRISHDRAIKQILRYLKGTTSFEIKYKRGNDMRLVGYSSHNVDIDDGWSTTGHVFYLGEFMAATIVACLGIWLWKILAKVMKNDQVTVEHVSEENQRADLLTKALARKRFKEMRSLLGVQELPSLTQKFRGSSHIKGCNQREIHQKPEDLCWRNKM